MDVNVCFSAHRDGSIHLQDDYWGSRHLSELGETKIYCAIQKKPKTCWTIYMKEKEGRFNLKIGTHSSFLQMKARKWKSLESCLVWKSKSYE